MWAALAMVEPFSRQYSVTGRFGHHGGSSNAAEADRWRQELAAQKAAQTESKK